MCYEEGNKTLDSIHRESVDLLARELKNLNFSLCYRVCPRYSVLLLGFLSSKHSRYPFSALLID